MTQRIPTKRSIANLLMGAAALLGIWAVLASVQSQTPRDQGGASFISRAAVEEVLRCRRQGGDDACFADVFRATDAASRLAPLRKTLVGEQIQHKTGLA